ncbi:MAG: TlpA family protein disulfide reductase [Thermoleophilia bacterium]|nr:TlpA family protein disulfide reductase [Thermoleophilia bacterium]
MRPRHVAQGLAVVGVVALLALLGWKLVHRETSIREAVEAGERPAAPEFTLPRLDTEGALSLRSLRGKVVVLNFWQSACVPCEQEAPALQRTWERYRGDGVVFVGVDGWDLEPDARRFLRKHGITYPQVYDGPGTTYDSYGVPPWPQTFVIDREGRAVDFALGELSEQELVEKLEAVLTG